MSNDVSSLSSIVSCFAVDDSLFACVELLDVTLRVDCELSSSTCKVENYLFAVVQYNAYALYCAAALAYLLLDKLILKQLSTVVWLFVFFILYYNHRLLFAKICTIDARTDRRRWRRVGERR